MINSATDAIQPLGFGIPFGQIIVVDRPTLRQAGFIDIAIVLAGMKVRREEAFQRCRIESR